MAEFTDLLQEIATDYWREKVGYSEDLKAANDLLFAAGRSDEEASARLNQWLAKHQPCLFGRLAAATGRLRFCILREEDLVKGDTWVEGRIQQSRTRWARATFRGEASGFLVVLLSRQVADARPTPAIAGIARKLCSLYLLQDIQFDQIYLDQAFLEVPGSSTTTWSWWAGVNYFSSHGDKRWWHDHRIPGGIAFSVNSVGHMVKSGILANGLRSLNESLGLAEEPSGPSKLTTLHQALELAMRTIQNAAEAVSGKATWLLPATEDSAKGPASPCPNTLSNRVAAYDCHEYAGFYHTDVTLPMPYFDPAVERPADIREKRLDFTYLFVNSPDNPDFRTMGEGRPIRADRPGISGIKSAADLRRQMEPQLLQLATVQQLDLELGPE